MSAIISLTTDFGLSDYYVGAMKGVIRSIAPKSHIVDIAHQIAPGDVSSGAFVMRHACMWFPTGTVHVGVIDPGVGTSRHLIGMRIAGQIFIAPDNGLLSLLHRDYEPTEVRAIERDAWMLSPRSNTFHGRDVLAPVAARLAGGAAFEQVGPLLTGIAGLPGLLHLIADSNASSGSPAGMAPCVHVLHVDRFGNVVLDMPEAAVRGHAASDMQLTIHIGVDTTMGVRRTYADVPLGEFVAYIGSAGLLEIAVNGGNAAERLGITRGDRVALRIV